MQCAVGCCSSAFPQCARDRVAVSALLFVWTEYCRPHFGRVVVNEALRTARPQQQIARRDSVRGVSASYQANARGSVESQMSNHALGATMRMLILGAVASVALLAGPEMAADLQVKAPPIAHVAPSWTGFYVGVNAVGSFGSDTATQNATFTSTALGANGLLSTTTQHAPKGWLAGGQLGYNWQMSSAYVLGVEADWQWTSQKATSTSCTPPAGLTFF